MRFASKNVYVTIIQRKKMENASLNIIQHVLKIEERFNFFYFQMKIRSCKVRNPESAGVEAIAVPESSSGYLVKKSHLNS